MSTDLERKTTVGIIQTGRLGGSLGVKYGEYPDMFKALFADEPFDYVTYAAVDMQLPKHPLECDAWIITGSKHGVYEDFDWIKPLEVFVRKLVASGQPTIGICFGHQLMAQAMGGIVEKFSGGWSIGRTVYTDLLNNRKARLLSFHQDQVTRQPESAEVIMTSDFCPYAGLKYSSNCLSLQPHPEHTLPFVVDLINQRRGIQLDAELADDGLASLAESNDQQQYGQWMAEILKGERRI
ncbi:type 1 glutamine amidotransferase [Sneathiella sp. CAU 1612]|uniref:Type 1 glutamine amidotransferase n=1 Tax=Sneathiella sedimenti TaxID=2816034 RepID=A0ABS3FA68_9PROT|nr:type 1 glutamine amidotransferase [Sneathiella sedimenti]MBO0335228.1 type 1 glutamine amidotransferase [Sneathiella sedimenti]